MTPLLTIGQLLSTQARLQPDRIGARDLERAMTFADWNARACRLANGLLALGLSRGDRIAVLAYNRVEWAEIYAAVAKAGLIAVPVNFRLTGPEAGFICTDCGVSAVIAEAALADLVEAMRAGLTVPASNYIVIGESARSGWQEYEALIAGASDSEPGIDVTPDDT
jgi:fatty-acyl-CoA synthase